MIKGVNVLYQKIPRVSCKRTGVEKIKPLEIGNRVADANQQQNSTC